MFYHQAIRDSGVLKLPSQRTLRDYTHYADATPGFSHKVDEMLMESAQVKACPERNKCVLLLLDEMHIREELVYDKHTGELIGFSNLDNISNHLSAYEMALSGDEQPPMLAKSVLVFMVRGLFTKLQFAYAQFPCGALTGEKLYKPFWDAVGRIETCGLKVCKYIMPRCGP